MGEFSSTRGDQTQRPEAEPGVLGCLGDSAGSPSFPLLTPTHSRKPVQQGGETLPPGTGAQAQDESFSVLIQLLGEQEHVCLSMLQQLWRWGTPDAP